MDTITIKTAATGNPILTWELRYKLTDCLVEAINEGTPGDHAGYLSTLQSTPPETEIGPDHELADPLTYFDIFEF